MLSAFLKKLLFARQFFMIDGKIEMLGRRQVMLPASVIEVMASGQKNPETAIKEAMRKEMADYAKKVGGSEEGMLANITYIFEALGMGKLVLSDLDNKNRRCIVRLVNTPIENPAVAGAVLAGIFSFLFQKDVDAEKKSLGKADYAEYVIK